jgi:hypothetical protein
MGVAIDVEKSRRVHRRVNLRRRQTGVAKQFLQRPEIGAASQQMRREAVPQRMRRQRIRQAQAPPGGGDGATDQVRVERAAARTDEQRTIALQRIRTLLNIFPDGIADRRDDRDNPGFRPLSGDSQRCADGQYVRAQRQRLRDAQSSAIKKQQDCEVASADPRRAGRLGRVLCEIHHLVGCGRAGKSPGALGRTRTRKLGWDRLLLGSISEEGANTGEFARRRCWSEPTGAPLRKEGAKIAGIHARQGGRLDCLAAIMPKEADEPMRGRRISSHGVRRSAPIMLEMRCPTGRERTRGMYV